MILLFIEPFRILKALLHFIEKTSEIQTIHKVMICTFPRMLS